ncbi:MULTISPECIES: ABC transporter ATP-binding protein [unclassified Ruegeria]|uniref:ABC transporter ATP-binding protein n=1 Tax=unclassified Ruegeria TaxID=2625375 RepID=UPI001491C43D|nr:MULTISPECIES: ABC transporter ATP-binding protein [unclassified Ruegeria]NOD77721.1 ATP-binding cassette domain-containing protein [Ruegeria sp. HKCCD4332]NOD89929.1 ATP-binding cassette domain-containing protein [Ruegeria sp. HKCCD4318]NOE14625.1 ATP-binding cassette domain-containing protein [Ruegeria sp. HKCCD4318-2]NOG11021.1 ABC transporter ATP-binding protein [Ruegeria sp. HKCCD4315]
MEDNTPILQVEGLNTTFYRNGSALPALRDVSFSVAQGEVLGLVGESGSGKSVTLRSIIGLARRYGDVTGTVRWQGRDLVGMADRALRQIQGREIAMIFQEPMTSLNPLLTVGLQLEETLRAHTDLSRAARRDRAIEMLDLVGIPSASQRLKDYPHQFSGGMRQRVMIAIALAANPKLLLADEPTTALDVTIQAQILDLILQLAQDLDMGVVMVTHDLGVVAQTCDRVAVMYAGRIVEQGPVRDVLREPRHPYTVGLMRSVPENLPPRTPLYSIPGVPPGLDALPVGCAFAPRCASCISPCSQDRPALSLITEGRQVACFNPIATSQGNAA